MIPEVGGSSPLTHPCKSPIKPVVLWGFFCLDDVSNVNAENTAVNSATSIVPTLANCCETWNVSQQRLMLNSRGRRQETPIGALSFPFENELKPDQLFVTDDWRDLLTFKVN